MFSKISVTAVALIAVWAVWSQTAAVPSFEVASVKPSAACCAPGQWRESKTGVDRIDFAYSSLRYCIAFAYRVKEYQISGPPWLADLRFDILAKGAEGTRQDQLPDMMQSLLAERFQLQVHRETREYNVIALALGKNGPKLKESPAEPGHEADGARFGMSMSPAGVGRMEVKRGNMTALANTLSRLLGRTVVDRTGLTGRYDFDLEYLLEDAQGMMVGATPGGAPAPAAPPGASIFSSIQQVGLRLNAQKLPLDTIVVDHAEKSATGN